MTQAVIFDLDGTLTDTEAIWDEVRRDLARQDGIEWPEQASVAMQGMSTPEWAAYMADEVGIGPTAADAERRTIEALLTRYAVDLPVLTGAVEAVSRLATRWPLGVASSSPRRLIEAALTAMGVRDLIGVVRSTEEGTGRGKPEPDAFLWTAAQLGCEPGRTVVVEDSGNGIRAGLNAGMPVVAVLPRFLPPPPDLLAQVAAVIDNLDELTEELVAGLGS